MCVYIYIYIYIYVYIYYITQYINIYYAFFNFISRLCYDISVELSELLGMARWYEKFGILGLSENDIQGKVLLELMILC